MRYLLVLLASVFIISCIETPRKKPSTLVKELSVELGEDLSNTYVFTISKEECVECLDEIRGLADSLVKLNKDGASFYLLHDLPKETWYERLPSLSHVDSKVIWKKIENKGIYSSLVKEGGVPMGPFLVEIEKGVVVKMTKINYRL